MQPEEFTARRGQCRECRGGDAVRDGGVRLVHSEHRSRDLGTVHPAERDEMSAGVHDGRGYQDRSCLGFGVSGRNHP
jgi:hypothetical protein